MEYLERMVTAAQGRIWVSWNGRYYLRTIFRYLFDTHTHHLGMCNGGVALAMATSGEWTPMVCDPDSMLSLISMIGPVTANKWTAEFHHSRWRK